MLTGVKRIYQHPTFMHASGRMQRAMVFPGRETTIKQIISPFVHSRSKSVFGSLEGGVCPPDSCSVFVPPLSFGDAIGIEWPCGKRCQNDSAVRKYVTVQPHGFHLSEKRSEWGLSEL